MDCLFQPFTAGTCTGNPSNEHLIQACLGGWKEADDIICDDCNNYFSRERIDQALCTYFRPIIIDSLGSLLHGRPRGQHFQVTSVMEELPFTLGRGGAVALRRIVRNDRPDGTPDVMYGPAEQADRLREIFEHRAGHGEFRMERLPAAEVDPMYEHAVRFDDTFVRAILKCLVEVVDFYARQEIGESIARRPELRALLRFVRTGNRQSGDGAFDAPLFALQDNLNEFFDYRDDDFSNRVIISFDETAGRIWGALQIANTAPLGVCFASGVQWHESFTLRYEQPILVPHRQAAVRFERQAVLPWRRVALSGLFWGTPPAALGACSRNQKLDTTPSV